MILYQTPMTHLVYKVIVESNQLKKEKLNKTEWDSSKTAFNRKFKQLVNRYGVAEQIFETNGEAAVPAKSPVN